LVTQGILSEYLNTTANTKYKSKHHIKYKINTIEHRKVHDLWYWKSRSWPESGTI